MIQKFIFVLKSIPLSGMCVCLIQIFKKADFQGKVLKVWEEHFSLPLPPPIKYFLLRNESWRRGRNQRKVLPTKFTLPNPVQLLLQRRKVSSPSTLCIEEKGKWAWKKCTNGLASPTPFETNSPASPTYQWWKYGVVPHPTHPSLVSSLRVLSTSDEWVKYSNLGCCNIITLVYRYP